MDCDAKTDMFQIKRLKNGINPDCKTSERSTKNISKNMLKFSQKLQEQWVKLLQILTHNHYLIRFINKVWNSDSKLGESRENGKE